MSKKYKVGFYIGRFQPLHNGHISIIRKMQEECEHIIIGVGSAQESFTERNPLNYEVRERMIFESIYQNYNIRVIPIPDRKNPKNDALWGDYVMHEIKYRTGVLPDAIYEGEEEERKHWYDHLTEMVDIITVPRTDIPISASELRQMLLDGDINQDFMTYTPRGTMMYYHYLQDVLRQLEKEKKDETEN